MIDKHSKFKFGITRSRFNDFIKCKGRKSLGKKRFSKASLRKTIDDDDITNSTLLSYSTKTSQIQLTEIYQPAWMNDYRKCCMLLSQVDAIMDDIKEEKAKKLTAVNEAKHRRNIQYFYAQGARKIQQSEKIIKGIQKLLDASSSEQQKKVFTNTIMALAMKTRQKTKQIRNLQQKDLKQRRQLEKLEINKYDGKDLMNRDQNQQQEWMSQEGFQSLEQKLSNERNQQIIKIVSSIHSLNTIYKQLQEVVIQQGSLLDRIDQNIMVTAKHVQQANQHLTQAQNHQRSPLANRIMLVLVLLIVVFTLILAFR